KDERLTATVALDHTDYIAAENRVKPAIRANGGPKVSIKTTGAKVSKGKMQTYIPVFDEETVNRDLLVQGVGNLRDYFQNRGYFDVDVHFQIKDTDPDRQEITYIIGLGDRHKVVKVEVQGNKDFNTDTMRKRMFRLPSFVVRLLLG